MKKPYEALLLKAIRKTGCEPINVQEIEENLIEMSLLPLDSEKPVNAVFKIIPWQKCLKKVTVISGWHTEMGRRLRKEKTKYFLAFVYTREVILVRPLELPANLKSYPSADEPFYSIIIDLKTNGNTIKI